MRIVIIRNDNAVVKDSVGYRVDCSSLDPELHAVQFDDVKKEGWREWKNAPNEKIKDLRDYEEVLALWDKAKADDEARIAKEAADKEAAEAKRKADEEAAQWALDHPPLDQYLAGKRYVKQFAGFVSPKYGPLYTDERTTSILTALLVAANENMITFPINWKGPNGWVKMDGEMMLGVIQETLTFVEACFNQEKDLLDKITSGEIVDKKGVDDAFK